VHRKEHYVNLNLVSGYWILGQEKENWYFVNNPNRIHLSLRNNPTRVGVFLDYEGGTLSFFNMDDQSLIYTLTHQFEGLLRPYIQHNPNDEENATPIVICPMPQREKPIFKMSPYLLTFKTEVFTDVSVPFICGKKHRKSHTSHSPSVAKVSFSDPEP
jgi:hypothetical protein